MTPTLVVSSVNTDFHLVMISHTICLLFVWCLPLRENLYSKLSSSHSASSSANRGVTGGTFCPCLTPLTCWGGGNTCSYKFLSFPFSSHNNCTSGYDFMLEIYLFALSIVHQIEGLSAAITLLMVVQGEYSI